MGPLLSITVYRNDLVDDPRFWGHVYWRYLEARAGDDFTDGLLHFLGVSSEAANQWLEEIALPVREGYFPEVAVTVPLKNGSRAGVMLSCYLDDFAIQQVIVSPEGTLTVISVSGGATQFPGLRWKELLSIADSAVSQGSVSASAAVLLLYLSVGLAEKDYAKNVRPRLRKYWEESRSGMRHIDEFLDRLAERSFEGRWEWTRQYEWTNDAEGGARNPRSARASVALPEIQRFLSELG